MEAVISLITAGVDVNDVTLMKVFIILPHRLHKRCFFTTPFVLVIAQKV